MFANRTRTYGLVAVVIAALGFLLYRGLGNATEYFRTADEAAAQAKDLGTRRFRLEGIVVEGSICSHTNGVQFLVEQNTKRIEVQHRGDPPELFQANIPVVLSGRFDASMPKQETSDAPVFSSDLVMIKHTNQYKEKNRDRVKDYVGKTETTADTTDTASTDGSGAAASTPIPACA